MNTLGSREGNGPVPFGDRSMAERQAQRVALANQAGRNPWITGHPIQATRPSPESADARTPGPGVTTWRGRVRNQSARPRASTQAVASRSMRYHHSANGTIATTRPSSPIQAFRFMPSPFRTDPVRVRPTSNPLPPQSSCHPPPVSHLHNHSWRACPDSLGDPRQTARPPPRHLSWESPAKRPSPSREGSLLLPLPVGEGWGEGLPRNHPSAIPASSLP